MNTPRLPDDVWAIVEPVLPAARPKPQGGRPRVPDRAALTGIIFVRTTGIPWESLPQERGCGSGVTCWRRLRDLAGRRRLGPPPAAPARPARRGGPHRWGPCQSGQHPCPGKQGGRRGWSQSHRSRHPGHEPSCDQRLNVSSPPVLAARSTSPTPANGASCRPSHRTTRVAFPC